MKKTSLIMPQLLTASCLFLMVFVCGVSADYPTLQQLGESFNYKQLPDVTIYTAKQIITMDENEPEATAVAVKGDKILAVGSPAMLEKAAQGQPYTVDNSFADKVIVPGFIAQHLHPFLSSACLTSEIISIEDWVLPTGTVPAVGDREGVSKTTSNGRRKA